MIPIERLTVSVGQQLHQAVQTRVPHLADVGSTAADGLDCGRHEVFIHAFNVRLPGKRYSLSESLIDEVHFSVNFCSQVLLHCT